MPLLDGTGPVGEGPGTGLGLGYCSSDGFSRGSFSPLRSSLFNKRWSNNSSFLGNNLFNRSFGRGNDYGTRRTSPYYYYGNYENNLSGRFNYSRPGYGWRYYNRWPDSIRYINPYSVGSIYSYLPYNSTSLISLYTSRRFPNHNILPNPAYSRAIPDAYPKTGPFFGVDRPGPVIKIMKLGSNSESTENLEELIEETEKTNTIQSSDYLEN